MVIVNTRPHAARLFDLAKSRSVTAIHISASMCPAHRSEVVKRIRAKLKAHEPCLVISTQVVEAGVDLDFPVVYRAMAGLDSIIQAAGRCNREGLGLTGKVYVFATTETPPPEIKTAANNTAQVLASVDSITPDPLDLDTIERYFNLHYWTQGGPAPQWDGPLGTDGHREKGGITSLLSGLEPSFRTAAHLYRLIPDATHAVVVPFDDEARALIVQARQTQALDGRSLKALWRRSQSYSVSLRQREYETLLDKGLVEVTDSGMSVVSSFGNVQGTYSVEVGLRPDIVSALTPTII